MAVWDKKTFWAFLLLLAGAVGQSVIYPFTSTCAVKGSTVTLPCSFTPLKSFSEGGRDVPLKIVRVLWCKNHEICYSTTPSVYDSESTNNDRHYHYLGDEKANCTLQIGDVQEGDDATFRFRMEADRKKGHFTNKTGVTVTAVDWSKMRIISSSDDKKFSRGETVTLLCTSLCTFHQLEVTWFKDGHALSETVPSIHLSPLTAQDSGSYTCALKANNATLSEPYSLQVEAQEGKLDKLTAVRLVLFTAHTLLIIVVASVIIKECVCRSERYLEVQPPDSTEEPRTNEEERGQDV